MDSIESFNSKDFPFKALILMSGSEVSKKLVLNVLNPEKPDKTMNKASVPITTPKAAIIVMIFIVLLLLFENK